MPSSRGYAQRRVGQAAAGRPELEVVRGAARSGGRRPRHIEPVDPGQPGPATGRTEDDVRRSTIGREVDPDRALGVEDRVIRTEPGDRRRPHRRPRAAAGRRARSPRAGRPWRRRAGVRPDVERVGARPRSRRAGSSRSPGSPAAMPRLTANSRSSSATAKSGLSGLGSVRSGGRSETRLARPVSNRPSTRSGRRARCRRERATRSGTAGRPGGR